MLYRVEGTQGLGPYHCNGDDDVLDDFLLNMCARHSDDTVGHPSPQMEGFCMDKCCFCCFTSLVQLKAWFTLEELQGLYKRGYRVYEIVGDLAAELPRQAIVFEGFKRAGEIPLEVLT